MNADPDAALKVPDPLVLKVTVPISVVAVPASLSVTIAVQTVGEFASIELGEHEMEVEVERCVGVSVPLPVLVE